MSHPLPELQKSNVEKTSMTHQQLSTSVKVSVKVLNAINIPDRNEAMQKYLLSDTVTARKKVRSYVEVRYNDLFDKTTAVEGTQPIWNEDLTLILR